MTLLSLQNKNLFLEISPEMGASITKFCDRKKNKDIFRPFPETKKITKSISLFNSSNIKKINRFDCDIVNLHWICNEMLSIENIKKINKPLVWTILDMWPFIGAEHICLDSNKSDIYWKNENQINIDWNDEIISSVVLTYDGKVRLEKFI